MLDKIVHWPDKHPKIWRAYLIICLLLYLENALDSAWEHQITLMIMFLAFIVLGLRDIHRKPRRGDDGHDDDPEPDPDWPDGDVVERMLWNREKAHR